MSQRHAKLANKIDRLARKVAQEERDKARKSRFSSEATGSWSEIKCVMLSSSALDHLEYRVTDVPRQLGVFACRHDPNIERGWYLLMSDGTERRP